MYLSNVNVYRCTWWGEGKNISTDDCDCVPSVRRSRGGEGAVRSEDLLRNEEESYYLLLDVTGQKRYHPPTHHHESVHRVGGGGEDVCHGGMLRAKVSAREG